MIAIVAALTITALAIPAGARAQSSTSCSTEVVHDVFRTSAAVEAINESGQAVSRSMNTRVTVKDVTAFIRLIAANPNGYCVRYTVEIGPEIVSPADLGVIESLEGNTSAEWRTVQNLSSGSVYTRVTFRVEPGSSVTFAPSEIRVKSLSWTGEAKRRSTGVMSTIDSLLGRDKLEQRTYRIEPDESSRVTVDLEHDGRRVDEWQAKYTLDDRTAPVTQDADAPVYYTASDSSVTFHFNDKAAEVTFTADPTAIDKLAYSAESYWSGILGGRDLLPFSTTPIRGGSAT